MHPVSHNDENDNLSQFVRLSDRYDHIGSLGSGGMAIVYKAHDRQLNRVVAIKRLSTENYSQSMIPRFEREARALAALNHPNIVDVYDSGMDEEHWPFLVMDFIEGETLEELIADGKLTDLDKIIEIFVQLLDGLGHAHSKGIVHRDLKPGNVMIKALNSDRFIVKLMDFGIAKTSVSDSEHVFRTQHGQVLGSPLYMSPEQTVTADVDSRSDIYSVGCMLYESLTRRPPFRGANMLETMTMHRSMSAEKISNQIGHLQKATAVVGKIEAVLNKSMQKSPKDRYQNCEELQIALREIQKSLREFETAEAFAREAGTRNKYKRIALAAGAIAITVLVAAGMLAIMESDVKPAPPPKKEISTDLSVVAAREGLLGRTWNDYWVSFDNPENKLELRPDVKFTDLPRAKVKTIAVGHRIEQVANSKIDYDRDLHGISYLTNLRRINIKNMQLNEAIVKEICTIKTLEDILILDTPLPLGSARFFAELPNLRHLALENCNLQVADTKEIANLSQLIKLSIDGNDLSNPVVLQPVSKLESLTFLSLSDSSVSDAGIGCISSLPNVTTLKLDGRLLTLAAIKKVARMQSLEFVMISLSKKLDDRGIGELSKLPKLNRLDLERCPNVTDGCIDSLIRMRSLNLFRALGTGITDSGVARLKEAKPRLVVKHSSFEDLRGVGAPDESKN